MLFRVVRIVQCPDRIPSLYVLHPQLVDRKLVLQNIRILLQDLQLLGGHLFTNYVNHSVGKVIVLALVVEAVDYKKQRTLYFLRFLFRDGVGRIAHLPRSLDRKIGDDSEEVSKVNVRVLGAVAKVAQSDEGFQAALDLWTVFVKLSVRAVLSSDSRKLPIASHRLIRIL